jgi:hypothetical protein
MANGAFRNLKGDIPDANLDENMDPIDTGSLSQREFTRTEVAVNWWIFAFCKAEFRI